MTDTVPAAAPAEMPVVRIVPMRRRHLRSVREIDAQVYPRPWSQALYLGELNMPEDRRVYVVARANRQVVGHGGLTLAAGEAHVTTIAVDPSWQQRGVGKRLFLVLVRQAITLGAQAITLEVRASNEAAKALYRRFGFTEAGTRAGYYAESGEDAVIMWATGTASDEYRRLLDQIESEMCGPPLVNDVGSTRSTVLGRKL